jgi:predicted metallo-beta-lactamase superfamily hydrolase
MFRLVRRASRFLEWKSKLERKCFAADRNFEFQTREIKFTAALIHPKITDGLSKKRKESVLTLNTECFKKQSVLAADKAMFHGPLDFDTNHKKGPGLGPCSARPAREAT